MTEAEARSLTKSERRRRRNNGEDVPKLKPGVVKGYKQAPEHVEKRKRFGPLHHAWKGSKVTRKSAYSRAQRMFGLGVCES